MYDIVTKRNGHLRVRNAAISHANETLNPNESFAALVKKYAAEATHAESNFIGKLVKKVTNKVMGGAMKRAEKEVAKKVGPEQAAEMRKTLEAKMATDKNFQNKMKELHTVGTIATSAALIGGAVVAAPIVGGALGIGGGAGAAGATGATVGAGTTVAGGTGVAALGAAAPLFKKPNTSDLTSQVQMPDKNSMSNILGPIAGQGLQASGKVASGSNESKIKQFLKDVVGPQTGKDLGDLAGQAAETAMIDFISTIRNKKLNGEKLPKGLDKIADLTLRAEDKAEQKIKQAAAGNIGEFIMTNWWVIPLVLFLLWMAARSRKSK